MEGEAERLLLTQHSQGARVDYLVESTPTGLYRIKYNGKGSMPVALRGSYTSHGEIKNAVNAYLTNKGERTNAKKQPDG